MRQFNLDEYLKNPERKVVTRDGKPVRIICTDREGNQPVVALINWFGTELAYYYYSDGNLSHDKDYTHEYDIFFAPTKHEGWTNIYQNSSGEYIASAVYNTEQDSKAIVKGIKEYVTTIKVEWEE